MIQTTIHRIPEHIGIIPDGNRRWAQARGLPKEAGYAYGILPALDLCELCLQLGVREITFYGFTQDNTKRSAVQCRAFQQACIDAVTQLKQRDADLLVVGNTQSSMFPKQLLSYTNRVQLGNGSIKVNLLVNYSWQWDFNQALQAQKTGEAGGNGQLLETLGSSDIPRIDLIIRWGGRRRLSGFLPLQTVYADFYIVDSLWPDFDPDHLHDALAWYQTQDITLGG